MSLFGKDTYNYITNEIDYEKLADAICNEQQKRNIQSENEWQNAITLAIIDAYKQKEENDRGKIQKDRKEKIQRLEKALKVENCFDEEGNPKNKTSNIKLIWNFIWAKESVFKDVDLLGAAVNGIVALFFLLIDWGLYIISILLFGNGICNIVNFIKKIIDVSTIELSLLGTFLNYLLYSVISFSLARTLIRVLKIECKYSKDNNYMLNFLAVIIAVIAIIVSVVVR